jgi:hypothetical protein
MADKKISALAAASTPLAGTEVFPIVQSSTTVKATIANVQAAPIAAQTADRMLFLNASKVPSTSANATFDGTNLGLGASPTFYSGRLAVGGHIAIATGNSLKLWNTDGTGLATLTSTGTNGLTIAASGNTTLSDGNLVIGTAGKGIDFTQDPNPAGMTSELLDDYEEGTFSPVIQGSSTAGTYEISSGPSYSVYTKVGRLVTIHSQIVLADTITGGGSGNLQITGLPFAKAGSSQAAGVVYLSGVDFDATAAYILPIFTTGGAGSTTLNLQHIFDNAGGSAVQISGLSAGDVIVTTITYIV